MGFTVIELLVVLAAIGLLLSVAAPRYLQHLDNARETTLKLDVRQLRDAIDKFHADQGRYPNDLPELVVKRYLHSIPVDPITQRTDSWVTTPPAESPTGKAAGNVADIHSGATGNGMDRSANAGW